MKEKKLAVEHGRVQSIITERLYMLGDKLAKREGYKEVSGLDAVYFYLIQKHNWLPSQVKSLNVEDLSFCLDEEQL